MIMPLLISPEHTGMVFSVYLRHSDNDIAGQSVGSVAGVTGLVYFNAIEPERFLASQTSFNIGQCSRAGF